MSDREIKSNRAWREELDRLREEVTALRDPTGQAAEEYYRAQTLWMNAEIERLRAELAAARAESALQPNYSCEHDGCAMREDSGYQEQARKYVDEYYKMKTELSAAKSVIENIVESEVEPLKALLREAYAKACKGEIGFNDPARLGGGIYTFWDRIRAALGD